MRRYLLTLTFLLCCFSTLSSFSFFSKKKNHTQIADQITNKVAPYLAKKHNMEWIGKGGGMMGCVYMMSLSYKIYQPLDQENARRILVDCTEVFLKAINQDEEIRPYLKNYPFTIENVEITLFSSYPNGQNAYDPYVAVATTENHNVVFYTKSPNKKYGYNSEYEEPYAKALEIVKSGIIQSRSSQSAVKG
ncbi:MAG: hypothetical protein H0W88_09265 [Parachlamydiaceae bacterium]|nr:hypothetical protein [Parachlamydiaceae bacterium]